MKRWSLATFALLMAACASPRAPQPQGVALWEYDVRETAGAVLEVDASFHGGVQSPLHVDDDADRFVEGAVIVEGNTTRAIDARSATWARDCALPCRVRYRMRLGDAAAALADVDVAMESGGALVSPPSAWLLRPRAPSPGARYRMRVTPLAAGARFVTGVHRATSGAAWEATVGSLDEASFAAFGALRTPPSPSPGVTIALAPQLPIAEETVVRWSHESGDAVTAYLGRPARGGATVIFVPGAGESNRGKTFMGGGTSILLRLAPGLGPADLLADWVLAHELVHAGFPTISPRFSWFGEGLATYVEPIARARAGLIAPERVWGELAEGLPHGVPGAGDGGLDGTHDHERVYWGGALYFLLADLTIRERTSGQRSLDDALRAMVASDQNAEESLEGLLALGDAATETTVLRDLYRRFGGTAATDDIPALMARLGVVGQGTHAHFDDRAPLAATRLRITAPAPTRAR